MDSKKKIPYKSYLFKMCSVLVLLVSVTFCWFVFSKENTIDSLQVEVTSVVNVTISDDSKEEWDDKVIIDSALLGNVISEFSGNGDRLYSPITEKNQVVGYSINYDSLNLGTEDRQYIEIITYVKTDGPICLYLGQASTITPASNKKNEDAIAGAVRLAIMVDGYAPFIWAPNTTYHYDPETKKVDKNGTPESSFTYVYSEEKNNYLDIDQIVTIDNPNNLANGVSEDKRFVWGDLREIENYTSAVEPIFKTSTDLAEEIEVRMVIRVWVEGTDREAVKELIGGKIKMNLVFHAVDNE